MSPPPGALLPARFWLYVPGGALWVGLCTWRLGSVPGMSLDEAWVDPLGARRVACVNPTSVMTQYAAPFPVLPLRLFGS